MKHKIVLIKYSLRYNKYRVIKLFKFNYYNKLIKNQKKIKPQNNSG